MARKTKSRPSRDEDDRTPPIPATAAVLMDARAVKRLLGVGNTTFYRMLSEGSYPRADIRLGKLNRWTVEAHNAAVQRLRERGHEAGTRG